MPIHVLLVGCNETFRATAAQLIGQHTHHVIAVADPESALNVLSGIKFDVLVIGELPLAGGAGNFLAAARSLQSGLRVVGVSQIARSQQPGAMLGQAPAPLSLDALRQAFRLPDAPDYHYLHNPAHRRRPALALALASVN